MKTAREYIETQYGTARLARTVELGDVESILDLIDDYADQFKPKWVKVSDILPKKTETVLVYGGSNYEDVATYNAKSKVFNCRSLFHSEITHWMPMPEPPTE